MHYLELTKFLLEHKILSQFLQILLLCLLCKYRNLRTKLDRGLFHNLLVEFQDQKILKYVNNTTISTFRTPALNADLNLNNSEFAMF